MGCARGNLLEKKKQLEPLMCREHPRCWSARSQQGQGQGESTRHGAGDAAGEAQPQPFQKLSRFIAE